MKRFFLNLIRQKKDEEDWIPLRQKYANESNQRTLETLNKMECLIEEMIFELTSQNKVKDQQGFMSR